MLKVIMIASLMGLSFFASAVTVSFEVPQNTKFTLIKRGCDINGCDEFWVTPLRQDCILEIESYRDFRGRMNSAGELTESLQLTGDTYNTTQYQEARAVKTCLQVNEYDSKLCDLEKRSYTWSSSLNLKLVADKKLEFSIFCTQDNLSQPSKKLTHEEILLLVEKQKL